ncbi:NADP-dependent oxidoreductase [Phytoactinopolyspora halotolerans]|uniref:NADP-dependent oxidoreductase n=1 Tax=Phytoactinopolyspora halotolerans TaxID=1981512 RepID=A0A6L9SHM6_9ACTN|nr:NADP-dependent oxidoreductase [Phytoactinopolyspora halotolerans]NEE03590.1 NADP-dependent oxidoreductase [Phytoactinopolyspora halotolerans]
MTEMMRAIRQETLGGPEVLHMIETERPSPGPTEVLVEVRAAGVNPTDWQIREQGYWLTPPFTLGWDVSGVVAAVAPGVNRFAVGDEVYGMPGFPAMPGCYAEYVAAPARHFAPKPSSLSHVEAAAVPLAALTAWQSLVEVGKVGRGDRVLVHAAAGGVGHLAVQLAKALGAHVVGTAGPSNRDFLHGLGTDEIIDYVTQDFRTATSEIDIVLDTVAGETVDGSLQVLRPGGLLIGLTNPSAFDELAATAGAAGRRAVTVMVAPDHHALEQITELIDDGALRPHISATYPLAEADQAHKLSQQGHVRGKIALTT